MAALPGLLSACNDAARPEADAPASSAPPAAEPSASASSSAASVPGDPALWVVGPNEKLQQSSTSFLAVVWREGCNGGRTGQVLAPIIRKTESEIVVTFSVTPKQTGAATCPGNNEVTYEVDLGEPLGVRALVDGQCVGNESKPGFCREGSVRFKP
ncbi:hypothetical protein AB0M20_08055 [Actinoplanes sp. NPDC051633]|uniref:hypothetical protein n=1 Tax=Actinoplanes sp. NPDC051633 TaxID=3155670 RepID=UPI0034370CC4